MRQYRNALKQEEYFIILRKSKRLNTVSILYLLTGRENYNHNKIRVVSETIA